MILETFFEKFDTFADAPNAVAKMRELVLDLAVSGKLVRQDPNDEAADELLSRLARERSHDRRSQTESAPVSIRYDLPDGWAWARFQDVAIIASNLVSPKDYPDFIHLAPDNIEKGNGVLLPCSTVREDGVKSANHRFYSGQIVYSKIRPNLAKVVVVDFDGLCSADMYPINALIDPSFLQRYMLSGPFLVQAVKTDTRVAMPKINQTELNVVAVPVPPLAEQKRIVAKVDELMALCDRLEAEQQERQEQHTALARASLARFAEAPTPPNLNLLFHPSYPIPPADLRKSILTLAVQGKLVKQDPEDEPVSDILARCLTERRKAKRTTATAANLLSSTEGLGYENPDTWLWQVLDDLLILGPTNGFSPKAVDLETPVRSLTLSATTSGKFKGEHSKFIDTEVPADSELWLSDGDILVQRGNTIDYVGVAAVYRGEPNLFIYPDLMMKLRVTSACDTNFIHLAMSEVSARSFLRARASGTSGSMPKINQATLKSLPLPVPPLAEQRRIVAKVDELMALVDQLETQLVASRGAVKNVLDAVVAELTNQTSSEFQ